MSHPTRVHALKILFERTATPLEIAEELGEPLNNVTYHVKQLMSLGCAELVRTRPARGGRVIEHLYRATRRAYFDDDAWEVLDEKQKAGVTNAVMRMISEDIAVAMAQGAFYERDDRHISRSPLTLDEAGWGEVSGLLKETLEELMAIQERVMRRADQGAPRIHAKVEIIQFCSPPPVASEDADAP